MKCIYAYSAAALCLSFVMPAGSYEVGYLLSDGPGAAHQDPNVVNAWGLAASPTGPFWLANEGTGTSSIVFADGTLVAPDVAVPADHSAHATGLVFNGGGAFDVREGRASDSSRFIFVTLEGRILGWSPRVDSANAVVAVDNSAEGEVYTGAALATWEGRRFLYVASFASGAIDVYDDQFQEVDSFTDPTVPPRYGPFNVAEIDGDLFVSFVPRDPDEGEEIPGRGHGLIDRFAPDGRLIERVATGGELDAPWAMVKAPGGFGSFSNKLLVGNFGDGRILGFNINNGNFVGALSDDEGEAIVIDGLWGLLFGNGGLGGDPHDLYFTAGPRDETHGLFGEIELEH